MKWFDWDEFATDGFANTPDPVPTGFTNLDKCLSGGLRPGLHMITAPPGTGKTSFAVQVCVNNLRSGNTSAYISFEQTASDIALRFTACATNAFRWSDAPGWARALKDNPADPYSNPVISALYKVMTEWGERALITGPSQNGESGPRTVEDVIVVIENAVAHGANLVTIDYLQLIDVAAKTDGDTERLRIVIDKLAVAAVEYGIPIILLAAQSREGQRSGGLTSISGSSRAEYSAVTLMTLQHDEEDPPASKGVGGELLMIHKNRYGKTAKDQDALKFKAVQSTSRWWEVQ